MKKADLHSLKEKIASNPKDSASKFTSFQVLNHLEDGITLLDREWKYQFLNDSSLTLKYKTREEVIGHLIWDVHPELIGSPFETLLRNAMASNEKSEFEEYFEPFDVWLQVRIFPSEEGLTLFYTDITENKKARAHREFTNSFVQTTVDAIVRLDTDLKITSWNKGAEKMSGFKEEEVLGEPMNWRVPQNGTGEELKMAHRILNGSEHETFFAEMLSKSGATDYLSMNLSPIKDTLDRIVGILVVARNITSLKETEKELLKSQRLYAYLSAINQCIVYAKTEAELLQKVCAIAEEVGNYRMAWIRVLDKNGKFDRNQMFGNKTLAELYRSFPDQDYTSVPFSITPGGKVLSTGKHAVSNNLSIDPAFELWKDELENQNLRSLTSLPLFKRGKLYAVLSLYSCSVNYFEENEMKFLLEATNDVSFGIEMIELEKSRLTAEEVILQKTAVLNQSQELALIGSFEFDIDTNIVFWSDELFRMFGYSPNEIEPTELFLLKHLHPDDMGKMKVILKDLNTNHTDALYDFRIITVEGEVKHISAITKFIFDKKGRPIKLNGTYQDITKKVQLDEISKRNKTILDQSQQMAHVGSSEIDLETGVSIWSNEQYRILGYEPNEVEPSSELFLSHVHPEDAEERIQMFKDVFAAQIDSTNEYRIITKTGEVKHLSGHIKFEFNNQGKAIKMFGTIQDITKRVKLDEITKRNKIILDQSQQMSHVGSTEIDLATGVSRWSDEQFRLLGYEPNEVEPSIELYLSHIHPEEKEERIEMFNAVFNAREDNTDEYRIVTKSGCVRHIASHVKFEFDAKGNPTKMFGTTQDITKRVEFDEINKKSKTILNQSQQMARVGSLEIDLKTNDVFWSDEQFRILGYEPNEVEPSLALYLSHVHKDEAKEKEALFFETFNQRRDASQKYRIVTKAGKVKSVYGHLKFESDANGNPTKMFGTLQDITKRVEIDEKLKYSEAFSRAVIDSLSSHVAVVDRTGTIVATNEAWNEFGREYTIEVLPRLLIGQNVFAKCEADWENCDMYTKTAILEMKEVLQGKKNFFKLEYPCFNGNEEKWFNIRIMKFDNSNDMIVVAHEDITKMKFAQGERDNMVFELENRVYDRTKELNEINTAFKDSINYAKRIQLGVLASPSHLKTIFDKSFVLSKPCNIVSGDFFWCIERKGLKFIVVADCTGHGVPGALMSMVGNALLNRIIKEGGLMNDPAKILSKLDDRLINALPGDDERKIMDGMDMAICVVNSEEKTIRFAGALRPLFILETTGSIIEIQGDRSCIGRGMELENKVFETKEIKYTPGQTMYLTSDGYYSQFGGPRGKKLMKKAFKSILRKLVNIPIDDQGEYMDQEFTQWQGNQQQIDDVMVVGIELE
jgi:PAS domain S-box-containing protein